MKEELHTVIHLLADLEEDIRICQEKMNDIMNKLAMEDLNGTTKQDTKPDANQHRKSGS